MSGDPRALEVANTPPGPCRRFSIAMLWQTLC
jgi:hypothetical protein